MNDMKKAIVIGASSGIGHEVARLLIEDGWTVGLAARREGLLLPMMHAHEDRVKVAKIDVTASNAVENLNLLIKRIGGMDLFFYAAGIGRQNRELTEDIELSTVRTNALGFTRMIGEAYRYFAYSRHILDSRYERTGSVSFLFRHEGPAECVSAGSGATGQPTRS